MSFQPGFCLNLINFFCSGTMILMKVYISSVFSSIINSTFAKYCVKDNLYELLPSSCVSILFPTEFNYPGPCKPECCPLNALSSKTYNSLLVKFSTSYVLSYNLHSQVKPGKGTQYIGPES